MENLKILRKTRKTTENLRKTSGKPGKLVENTGKLINLQKTRKTCGETNLQNLSKIGQTA